MKIYTKKGDQGKTSLFGGKPISKNNAQLEAYGQVDELNSVLGLVLAEISKTSPSPDWANLHNFLLKQQHILFNIGSHLALGDEKMRNKLPELSSTMVKELEDYIDQMEKVLTPLKEFILPGGSFGAALFHLARTVCRRSERAVVAVNEHNTIEAVILEYLNRLSDFFFVAARYFNHKKGVSDQPWEKV